jgi:N-acetylglucosaminyl-diphospho-decaprenol L-rhamnosyltransferase
MLSPVLLVTCSVGDVDAASSHGAGPASHDAEMNGGGRPAARVAAVIINYNAGRALAGCVASLQAEGVGEIVVVDNASADSSMTELAMTWPATKPIHSARNLGYGAGANLGARATTAEYLLVCNPDLVASPGSVASLAAVLDDCPKVAIVGPMLREVSGVVYPSGREFPGMGEAIGHGFLGLFWGGNPWTRRYRRIGQEQHRSREADWVSGAFLLVRREAFDEVGGFDERYFMYVEDVDLCWRLRQAGWQIWYEPSAEVVHEQGRSASRHPYRMLVSHHRSMWLFARQTAQGPERALLPLVALGLAARLVLAWAEHLLSPRSRLRSRPD